MVRYESIGVATESMDRMLHHIAEAKHVDMAESIVSVGAGAAMQVQVCVHVIHTEYMSAHQLWPEIWLESYTLV